MGEALEAAGGLIDEADTDWVSKNLNLAEKLKDGAKVYVPFINQSRSGGGVQGESLDSSSGGGGSVISKVNVNTASVSELDKLAGIGQSRASAIIENRPYSSVDELVDKAGIPKSVLDKIREQVSVY